MIITILGSGASEGIPAFLCTCSRCAHARKARGPEIRQNACTLVTSHTGTSLLIDMPPQFKMAWDTGGFDQSALLGILITHRHEDHTLGLKYLVDAHPRNGVTDPHPIAAWMPQEVEEQWFGRTPPAAAIRVQRVAAARPFEIGPFTVTPVETLHLRPDDPGDARGQSFGYLIDDSDGTRLAYMVDSPPRFSEETSRILGTRRLDCLVFECTFAQGPPVSQHTDLEGLQTIRRSLDPRIMIASHVSHLNLGHRDLQELLGPQGITVAFDGMRVEFHGAV